MARPKGFDRERALEGAMCAFWRRGYEATSVQNLVDATGLSRSSLYDTFGDKHAVYLAALGLYSQRAGGTMRAMLEAEDASLETIRRIFEAVVSEGRAEREAGCMAVNACGEVAARDPEAAGVLAADLSRNEAAFLAALRRAEARGEMGPGRDLRALARFLVNALHGLRVTAKVTDDAATLGDIVAVTLAALT